MDDGFGISVTGNQKAPRKTLGFGGTAGIEDTAKKWCCELKSCCPPPTSKKKRYVSPNP